MKNLILLFVAIFAINLMACKKEKGKTPHGFEYVHHIKKGGKKPAYGDVCYFNVDMKINDSIVSTSRERNEPARFPLPDPSKMESNYPPIADALALMSIGDSLTLYFPTDSLPRPIPGFEKAKFIVYEIALTDIKSEAEFNKEVEAEQKKRDAEREIIRKRKDDIDKITREKLSTFKQSPKDAKTTASGISYYIIEDGKGNKPKNGEMVNVYYHGMLENGKVFDSAFERGDVFSFPVGIGKVIKGWDECIPQFNAGTKAVIFVPAEQGYGKTGAGEAIPPNANLVFYVEVKSVGAL